jgi:hypothetical protein
VPARARSATAVGHRRLCRPTPRIHDAEIDIHLQPGELLLFDNLALAHGRRGTRQPGELCQRVFGHHLQPAAQRKLRDHVLTAFYAAQPAEAREDPWD